MIEWIKKATGANSSGSYNFHIKSEPSVLDTSTTLTLTAFTNKSQVSTVPCNYKWFRIRNGLTEEICKYKGSSYVCEPSDIGAIIQAQITSMDSEFVGKAHLQFGPVKLDLTLKKQLQNTLSCGSTVMPAHLCYKQQEKECQLKIFENMIKICHCYSEANYTFNYSIYEPRIQILHKDSCKVQIVFGERYQGQSKRFLRQLFKNYDATESMKFNRQSRIQIKFNSRSQKDLFIFVLKSFYTKKQLKNAVVLQKIQHIDFKQNSSFDYLLQIETLKEDLQRTIEHNNKIQTEKSKYKQEVNKLQREMEEIITTYTKIIQNKCKSPTQFNQSYSVLTTKKDQIYDKKFNNLQTQNFNLNERIRMLTNEMDQIKFNTQIVKNNQTVQNINVTQQQPFQNAFTKKKVSGKGLEQTNFLNILDQLEMQESQVKEYPEEYLTVRNNLQNLENEKKNLEKNLQKSHRKIDSLEKQLHLQGSSNQNITAVNFRFGSANKQTDYEKLKMNLTAEMQKIKKENMSLKKVNDSLALDNKNLQSELSISASRIIVKKAESFANIPSGISNQKQIQSLQKQKKQLQNRISELIRKNENLVKDIKQLEGKHNRKLNQIQKQLQIYRQNQNAVNRSQYLSMEMESYNEEQVKLLKQHNQFLTTENQKLVKACEKYMIDAKQCGKLRQQNLNLKERLNRRLINPENSSSSFLT